MTVPLPFAVRKRPERLPRARSPRPTVEGPGELPPSKWRQGGLQEQPITSKSIGPFAVQWEDLRRLQPYFDAELGFLASEGEGLDSQ